MSEVRKDKERKVLQKGEGQRKNGKYYYRYRDLHGKRRTVTADGLIVLRQKESDILRDLNDRIDTTGAEMTVADLVDRYIQLKQGVRYSTKVGYKYVLNFLRKQEFGFRKIGEVKVSDAKLWLIKLHGDGYAFETITSVRGIVKLAFQMAYNDDILKWNPFDFRLDIIPNNTKKRQALSEQEQNRYLQFIAEDNYFNRYIDEILVMLGTGLRVSEFCGLTKRDLDFENRRIRVDHQLSRTRHGKYYVEKTKTESGIRYIPMSEQVYQSLKNMLANRQRVKREIMIDGYSGFIMLDRGGNPKIALHIQHFMKRLRNKYNESYASQLPPITPHVLRHTFCTNMANAGMDVKSLQYLMGHSDVIITMNVYTHSNYENAEKVMSKLELPYYDFTAMTGKDEDKNDSFAVI